MDGGDDLDAGTGTFHAARKRTQVAELLGAPRGGKGDLHQRIVLEHSAARHVAALRLGLAPSRNLDEDGEIARLADAVAKPLPGAFRMLLVSRRRSEQSHFVVEPTESAARRQPIAQIDVDVAQMGYVGDRVFDLRLRQRPARPVGEARRLVDAHFGDGLDEFAVGNLLAEAADHGGNLRVEQRRGDPPCKIPHNLNVLPRSMKDFDELWIGHQIEEGSEIQPLGERIDRHGFLGRSDLHDAELGPKGRFPQKFGIDSDERMLGYAAAYLRQLVTFRDQAHGF